MGSGQSQSFTSFTDIQTDILQSSVQRCSIICSNEMSGNTFIWKNIKGNIKISQTCVVSDATCAMKTAFEGSIQNLIDSLVKQNATTFSGLSLSIDKIEQETTLVTLVQNRMSQIINATCNVSSINTMNNNYFYVENMEGDFTISQAGNVSGASCLMDNLAKAATDNTVKTKAEQSSKVISALAIGSLIFIVGALIIGAIVIMKYLKKKKKI